jgi:hypothetical protein
MDGALRVGVLACAAWALLALGVQFLRTRAYGRRPRFAPAAASAARGVAYAFGPGMSPAAKESAREHLPVYFTGVTYHLGVYASLAALALALAGVTPGGAALAALRVLSPLGAAAGAVLLARRATERHLRALSCPDDFAANALTTLFAALTFAATLTPAAEPARALAAMALLLYVPLGKIRHCVFFFSTRAHSAAHFGRRGVLPPPA